MALNVTNIKVPIAKTEDKSSETEIVTKPTSARRVPLTGRKLASDKSSTPRTNILSSRGRSRRISSSSSSISPEPAKKQPSKKITSSSESKKKSVPPPRKTVRSPSSSPEPPKKLVPRKTVRSPSSSPEPAISSTRKTAPSESKTYRRRYSPSPVRKTTSRRDLSSSPEPDTVRFVKKESSVSPIKSNTSPSTRKMPTFASIASGTVKTSKAEVVDEDQLAEEELVKLKEQNEIVGSVAEEELPLDTAEGEVIERKSSSPKKISNDLLSAVNKIGPPVPTKPEYVPRNDGSVTYVLIRITCRENLATIKSWIESIVDVDEEFRDSLKGLYPIRALRVVHNRIPKDKRPDRPGKCYEDNYDQYRESIVSLAAVHPDVWEVIKLSNYAKPNAFNDHQLFVEEHKIRDGEKPSLDSSYPCVPELFCCFKERKYLTVEQSMEQMYLKMQNMVECGFVKHNEYNIRNPTMSRDFEAEPKLFCIITFSPNVPEINRTYIKSCLDQTKFRGHIDPSTITEDEPAGKHIPYMCIISWARLEMMAAIDPRYRSKKPQGSYQPVSSRAINETFKSTGKGRSVSVSGRTK